MRWLLEKSSNARQETGVVDYLVHEEQLTVKQSCSCVALSRASYYRKPMDKAIKDVPVIDALNSIIAKHGLWRFHTKTAAGYGRVTLLLSPL
jgi:hypothetical protein